MTRQELGLPGWKVRSVWGRDERHLCYFALLWDDTRPTDAVTRSPHVYIQADSTASLAERIAERTGQQPQDVRQAMTAGTLIADSAGPLARSRAAAVF